MWPGITCIRLRCYNVCTPTAIQCSAKNIYNLQCFHVSLPSTFPFPYKTIPHPSFTLFVTSSYLTSFLPSFLGVHFWLWFDFLCIRFRASLICINNCPTRCNTKQSLYSASSLYTFRMLTTPIMSTQNCNYSLRYCAATSRQRGHVGRR